MTGSRTVAWGEELVKLHDGFRADLATLRRSAAAGEVDPRPELAVQLRTHCLTFCEGLHLHHSEEDEGLFPHLREERPELAEVLDRLRREHVVVARLLAELRATLDSDSADSAAQIDRLGAELEAHLDYEEEYLVPVLNAMTSLPGH